MRDLIVLLNTFCGPESEVVDPKCCFPPGGLHDPPDKEEHNLISIGRYRNMVDIALSNARLWQIRGKLFEADQHARRAVDQRHPLETNVARSQVPSSLVRIAAVAIAWAQPAEAREVSRYTKRLIFRYIVQRSRRNDSTRPTASIEPLAAITSHCGIDVVVVKSFFFSSPTGARAHLPTPCF